MCLRQNTQLVSRPLDFLGWMPPGKLFFLVFKIPFMAVSQSEGARRVWKAPCWRRAVTQQGDLANFTRAFLLRRPVVDVS